MYYFEIIALIICVVLFATAGIYFVLRKRFEYHKEESRKWKERYVQKDDLLSRATHEIRTPMTVVKGYTDFLLMGDYGELNPGQKETIQRVHQNTENLLNMVDSILEMTRLESDKAQFLFEHFYLRSFLESLQDDFLYLYKTKLISLTFSNPNDFDPMIFTDQEKLRCILHNLLGNAYKFTPENGEIELRMEAFSLPDCEDEYVKISVSDNGCGISPEDQEMIFEKFHMAHERQYAGTGLGLNIVKKLVGKLGGEIWVHSVEGVGSTFEFFLPLGRPDTLIQSECVNYK